MLWSSRGRGSWPAVPVPGRLDEAAERLVWVALAHDRAARCAVFARSGVGPCRGAEPASPARSAALAGLTVSDVTVALARVRRVARGSGTPAVLRRAVASLHAAQPGTASGLALVLHRDGVTRGVLHPRAVLVLAALWGVPAPALYGVRRAPGMAAVLGEGRLLPGLPRLLAEVHRCGVIELTEGLRLPAWPEQWGGEQRRDLLEACGLWLPGSPVVWDQVRSGWLQRPVERLLAACGPLPAADVHAGLLRARHAWRLRVQVPAAGLLLAWAGEAPGLLVSRDGGTAVVGVAGPRRLARGLLTAADRLLLSVLRHRRAGVPTSELTALLLGHGLYRTPGSVQAALASTPYLRPFRVGRIWHQQLVRPDTAHPTPDSSRPRWLLTGSPDT